MTNLAIARVIALMWLAPSLLSCQSATVQPTPAYSHEDQEALVVTWEETHRPLTREEIETNKDVPAVPNGRYRPLVDPASIRDRAKYERDLWECFVLADQHTNQDAVGHGAVAGALGGAGLSALLSWIIGGNPGIGAAGGAVIGGVGGAVTGAQSAALTYETIYRNCLIGRGWHVLR